MLLRKRTSEQQQRDPEGRFASSGSGGAEKPDTASASHIAKAKAWLRSGAAKAKLAEIAQDIAGKAQDPEFVKGCLGSAINGVIGHYVYTHDTVDSEIIAHAVQHIETGLAITASQAKDALASAANALASLRKSQLKGDDEVLRVLAAVQASLSSSSNKQSNRRLGRRARRKSWETQPRARNGQFGTLEAEMAKIMGTANAGESGASDKTVAHTVYTVGDVSFDDEDAVAKVDRQIAEDDDHPDWQSDEFENDDGSRYQYNVGYYRDDDEGKVHAVVTDVQVMRAPQDDDEDGEEDQEDESIPLDDAGLSDSEKQEALDKIAKDVRESGLADQADVETEQSRIDSLSDEEYAAEIRATAAAKQTADQQRTDEINTAVDDALAQGWQPTFNSGGTMHASNIPDRIRAFASPSSRAKVHARLRERGFFANPKKSIVSPLRRKVDNAKKTLYVSRPLANAADVIGWAKGQGFSTTLNDDRADKITEKSLVAEVAGLLTATTELLGDTAQVAKRRSRAPGACSPAVDVRLIPRKI